MGLHVIHDDDGAYEHWLGSHPSGYVLDAQRNPKAAYVVAHHAQCPHISELQRGYTTWTAGEHLNVVADSMDELDQRTEAAVGVRSRRTRNCWL